MLLGRRQSFGAGGPVGRYRLSRCAGFAVHARDGARGVVEEVAFRSQARRLTLEAGRAAGS